MDGDRMAVSMYNISFRESFERKRLCTNDLQEEDVVQLRHAIEDLYYFEFIFGEQHCTPLVMLLCCCHAQMTSRSEGS